MRGYILAGLVSTSIRELRASSTETCIGATSDVVVEYPLANLSTLQVEGEYQVQIQAGSTQNVVRIEADTHYFAFLSVGLVALSCPPYQTDVDFNGDDDSSHVGIPSATECAVRCETQGSSHFTFRASASLCSCKHGAGAMDTFDGATSGLACSPPGVTETGCPSYQINVDFEGDDHFDIPFAPSAAGCADACRGIGGSTYFTFNANTGRCLCKRGPGTRKFFPGATSGQACAPPGAGLSVFVLGYTELFSTIIEQCGLDEVRKVRPRVTVLVPELPRRVIARDGADVSFVSPVVSGSPLAARAFGARVRLNVSQVTSLQVSANGGNASVELGGHSASGELLAVSALSDAEVFLLGSFSASTFSLFSASGGDLEWPLRRGLGFEGAAAAADNLSVTATTRGAVRVDVSMTAEDFRVTKLDLSPVIFFGRPVSAGRMQLNEVVGRTNVFLNFTSRVSFGVIGPE